MSTITKILCVAGLAITVAGCSQTTTPQDQITIDPVLSKYDGFDGGGGCPGGQTAGAADECYPPDGGGDQPYRDPQGGGQPGTGQGTGTGAGPGTGRP